MKRSRSVTLITMASASLVLAACEETPDTEGEIYRNSAECSDSDFVPSDDCAPLIEEGERIHQATAPRYESMSLCESENGAGACNGVAAEGAHYYSPIPVGYFVTGALAGNAISNLVRPVYREKSGRRFYTTGGGYLGYVNNRRYATTQAKLNRYNPQVRQAAPRVQTRTTVASRSGFGSRSGSFGLRGG